MQDIKNDWMSICIGQCLADYGYFVADKIKNIKHDVSKLR